MIAKVYDSEGEHVATCAYWDHAAMLVSALGNGATIRAGSIVLWTEGEEECPAAESYDIVQDTCERRLDLKAR